MVRKTKAIIKREAREAIRELLDKTIKEQEEEEGERIPGRVIRGVKTPWRRSDVDRIFPAVSLIPEETIPITYNGVQYQLLADVEMVVPSIIRDIYLEHRRRARQGSTRSLASLGVAVVGQGGLGAE